MDELPKRKKMRLTEYDYSQNGYYFVTICTNDKQSILWDDMTVIQDTVGAVVAMRLVARLQSNHRFYRQLLLFPKSSAFREP